MSAVKIGHSNSEAIRIQGTKIDRLTMRIASAKLFLDSMKAIEEMQTEVIGLQVENRRILDRVFGEDVSE